VVNVNKEKHKNIIDDSAGRAHCN